MGEEKVQNMIPGSPGYIQSLDFRAASWWAGPWWMVLVKGIFAISIGIFAWGWPVPTLWVLVILFGIFSLVDGIFTIVLSSTSRKFIKNWGWSLAAGLAGTTIGFLILFWPVMTALMLLYFIAAWIMIMGILHIANAIRQRKETLWGWPLAIGIMSIVFSIVLFASPLAGAIALLWIWGIFAIVYGVLMCIKAYRTRRRIKAKAG